MPDDSVQRVIKLVTPLPCGTLSADGETLCSQDAYVAIADRLGRGEWMVLPICEAHTRTLSRLYPAPDEPPAPA